MAPNCRWLDLPTIQHRQGSPVLCLCIVLSLAGTVSARYGNPAGTGPVSRGTMPPGSYGGGLVSAPNPVDNTSNLVVTGNVGGGKSFRGHIPYGSTTSFGGRLGSTSLDPFLRYSAIPEERKEGPSGYSPFYSPTGTVPRIPPGSSGVFAPGSPKIAGVPMQFHPEQPVDLMPAPEVPQPEVSGGRTNARDDTGAGAWQGSRSLPLSKTPEEMRRIIAGEPRSSLTDRQLSPQAKQVVTSEEYQRQLEQLQRDFDRVKTNASQFEQDMKTGRHTSVVQTPGQRSTEAVPPPVSAEALRRIIQPQSQPQRPSASTNPPADQDLLSNPVALAPDGSATPGQTPNQTAAGFPELALVSPQTSPTGARGSASTESRLHLYGRSPSAGQSPSEWAAQKSRIDAIFAPWTDGAAIEKGGDSSGTLPAMQRVEETARAFDAPGRIIEHPLRDALSSTPGGEGVSPSQSPPRASLEGAAPQAKVQPKSPGSSEPLLADRAAPKPGDPDSVAQEKFDGYLKSARSHLRQGRYARAAESFSLASVYHPRDARPQIGRSHALLAIGEYLGSAACLAKAIELDPRSTLARSDLIEAIGGPDPFVQRITDLEQCAKTHDAPGLQLLLAYIYQQMDRPEEARDAVRAAKKGLPSSMSVDLLEAAIGTRS